MKKSIILFTLVAALFSSCQQTSQHNALVSANDSLQAVINERDAALQEMINTINFIEEGFRAINEAQGRINLNVAGNEVSRKEKIANDLSFINQTLTQNKAEIDRLRAEVNKNKSASAQMKQMINNLQRQLIQKGEEIASLRALLASKDIDIAQLDSTVTVLALLNADLGRTVVRQESEINTVWYAIGTKSELKGERILKSGNVLLEKDANLDYFTKADKRELKTINTYAKGAKLLTSHPDGSYTLTKDENKEYVLTITNPDKFWEHSRRLVIQVKL